MGGDTKEKFMEMAKEAAEETARPFSSTGICREAFRWLTKTVRVEPFLVTHEIVQKALLDELRLQLRRYGRASHRRAARARIWKFCPSKGRPLGSD